MRFQYQNASSTSKKGGSAKKPLLFALLIVLTAAGFSFMHGKQATTANNAAPLTNSIVADNKPTAQPVKTNKVNHCASNTEAKSILISVGQRHLWACEGTEVVHDTAIITGNEQHPETLTPRGTYHIYAKQQNTTLTGTDTTGSWKRPVFYWMPFLDNQYGTYGFHDATWRKDSDFGSVDPNSNDASHGCPELSLVSQKWLYEWAPVKTSVVVQD